MNTEQNLLKQARQFNVEALAEIYDSYSPGIFRYAMRFLSDEILAEECVAETFHRLLQAFKNRKGPEEHLQAYIYRIAHNWITDHFRRTPNQPSILSEDHEIPVESTEGATIQKVELEAIQVALHSLTEDQRQVIILKYIHGLSNEEISKVVCKPVGAVKALQFRGLEALRRLMHEKEIRE